MKGMNALFWAVAIVIGLIVAFGPIMLWLYA
jgi:hypothetical protein